MEVSATARLVSPMSSRPSAASSDGATCMDRPRTCDAGITTLSVGSTATCSERSNTHRTTTPMPSSSSVTPVMRDRV
eukprot:scaffold57158_cov31-Tisochrysis_lutea.AAC.3